jgi:pyruvate/2-oxoglutarate dehydrogenase complex dihydrolipoamide acyltransferase (E2) component
MFALSKILPRSISTLGALPMRSFAVEEVKLPSLGESVTEGSVQTWIKKLGDYVREDEVVVAIESDKMGQEIRSSYSGKIVELMVEEGSEV